MPPTASLRDVYANVRSRYALPLVPVLCLASSRNPLRTPVVRRVKTVTRPAVVEVVNEAVECV